MLEATQQVKWWPDSTLDSDFKSPFFFLKCFIKERCLSHQPAHLDCLKAPSRNLPGQHYVFSKSNLLQTETKNNENQVPVASGFSSLVDGSKSWFFLFVLCEKMITPKGSWGLSKGGAMKQELRKWNLQEWHCLSFLLTVLSMYSFSYILFLLI